MSELRNGNARTTLRLLLAGWVFLLARDVPAQPPSDERLWAQADARIEKHRKADAAVVVLDAEGKPVPGAKVAVEQTRHAFLFGCNIFIWGKTADDKRGDGLPPAFRRAAQLRHAAVLLVRLRAAAGQAEPCLHRAGRPLVPGARHRHQGPPAGLELRRSPLAARRPGRDPPPADGADRATASSRFAGLIDRWDVVNEATQFDRDEFLRQAPKMTCDVEEGRADRVYPRVLRARPQGRPQGHAADQRLPHRPALRAGHRATGRS